jgi:hypothetical protein
MLSCVNTVFLPYGFFRILAVKTLNLTLDTGLHDWFDGFPQFLRENSLTLSLHRPIHIPASSHVAA